MEFDNLKSVKHKVILMVNTHLSSSLT